MTDAKAALLIAGAVLSLAAVSIVFMHKETTSRDRLAAEYCEGHHGFNPHISRRAPQYQEPAEEFTIIGDRRADSEITASMHRARRSLDKAMYAILGIVVLWILALVWEHYWKRHKRLRKEQHK